MKKLYLLVLIIFCLTIIAQAQTPILSDANPVITPQNAMQVTQLAMIGRGYPRDVAFSPDGKLLAIGASIGVWVYDANAPTATPRLLTDINQQGLILDIVFSPDGQFIAAGTGGEFPESGDNALIVWDVQSGEAVHHLTAHDAQIADVTYSPDGLTIATSSDDDKLYIWDAQTGEIVNSIFDLDILGSIALDFSPDGQFIASAHFTSNEDVFTDNTVRIRDVNTGEVVHQFNQLSYAVAYSPDGQWLASGGYELKVWNTQTGELLAETPRSENSLHYITHIEFSPDGQFIVTSNGDGFLRIYNTQTVTLVNEFAIYDNFLSGFAIHPHNQMMVLFNMLGNKNTVLWADMQGNITHTESFNRWFNNATFSSDLQTIYYTENYRISAVDVNSLASYQPASDDQTIIHLNHDDYYQSPNFLLISPDDQTIIIPQVSNTLSIMNLQTGDLLREIPFINYVNQAHYHHEHPWLTTIDDGVLMVHDVTTGELLQTIASEWDINSFAYDTDEDRIIVSYAFRLEDGYYDMRVEIYDFGAWSGNPDDAWQQVNVFPLAGIPDLLDVMATPDGRLMWHYNTQNDERLIIYDVDTFNEVQLAGSGLLSPKFSPDGQLVMVRHDYDVQLWDAQTGEWLMTLRGHTDWVDAEWRADGRAIISSSADGTIRVWGINP